MTIFAGVFNRRKNGGIPESLVSEIQVALSRHPDDEGVITEFSDDHVYLAKVDIGILGGPGNFSAENITAFVAGDPLLQVGADMPKTRADGLHKMALDLSSGGQDALRACRGAYCAVIYEGDKHTLHLVTDKLGIRPVYYWVTPNFIVFATALRILEALSFQKKSLNLQAVAEISCFGYPLADRSPYEDIFTLYAGEIACFSGESVQRQRYWRWDGLPAAEEKDNTNTAEKLFSLFIDAVKIRLREQKKVAAFLSGGLDSRAIVGALKYLDCEAVTSNFASLGSQDQVFGQLAAEKLGTFHTHLPSGKQDEKDHHHKLSVNNWINSEVYRAHDLLKPRVVWSGDGGSLGLGHIYLNSELIKSSREADSNVIKQEFMVYNNWGLGTRLLEPKLAREFLVFLDSGIQSELDSLRPVDAGRLLYLFLLLNDQRRHLFNHFENMDLGRVEFELPFFDTDFITEVIRQPIDQFLYHTFYLDWLKHFPKAVLEVPWQAYPGHVPCPLPLPSGLAYQWESSDKLTRQSKKTALNQAKELLRDTVFARKYLNRFYLISWRLLVWLDSKNRRYLLNAPRTLHRYWLKCH